MQIERQERKTHHDRSDIVFARDSAIKGCAARGLATNYAADIVEVSACALSELIASHKVSCAKVAHAHEQATRWTSTRPLEAVSRAGGTDRWERLHLVKPPGLPRCSQSPAHVRAYSQVCSASAEAR